MAANVLRSKRAIHVSIEIVRAFARLSNALRNKQEISNQLVEIKSFLLKHSHANDKEFRRLWDAFERLSQPSKLIDDKPGKIGFDLSP